VTKVIFSQTDAGKPNVDPDDSNDGSETGTVFEPSPVGPVYELQPLGETGRARRPRRRPSRGRFPGLLRRLNMKVSRSLNVRPSL
jgi:hypothetical protein